MTHGPRDLESDIEDVSGDPGAEPDLGSRSRLEAEIEAIRGSEAGERFEARASGRRDRLERASSAARAEAAVAFGRAHRVGDAIPFGQPILRGHHSQRRHERDLERIDRSMRRGVEASQRSDDLARRARSVGSAGVSSDDPAAVQELRLKLLGLEATQEKMKAANAAIRRAARGGTSAQIAALVGLGVSEDEARSLIRPDFAGRIGFPSYALTNNNAEIARVKKRIAQLQAQATTPARDSVHGSIEGLTFTIFEDKEANRTRIRFSDKPGEAVRARLHAAGFRWVRSEGVWQRQLSNQAWHRAHGALGLQVQ